MQKYRRKGKIIEPLVGTHMVAWLDGDVLVVVNRATLDREYERVEEPKDWWYRCADCGQPIPLSSDWLWKYGMCGDRICEACGKKRQAKGKHGIVYICQACGAKLYDGLKDVVMHKGRNLCQSCYRRIIERERVDEKSKSLLLCAACGKSLDYGEAYGHENGTGVFCAECWGVAQVKVASEAFRAKCEWERTHKGEWSKKPTSLTLADLTPGDVFKWYEDLSPVQVLVSPRTLYSADKNLGRFVPEVRLSQSIIYLRHHDLTRKQLLWIGASDEERKALDDSIRDKWLRRLRGHSPTQPCALCEFHGRYAFKDGSLACPKCILDRAGQRCEMGGSPWMRWYNNTRRFDSKDWRVETEGEYERTRHMAFSLANFLPNIDPTRIEVEATPVEWPGVKK